SYPSPGGGLALAPPAGRRLLAVGRSAGLAGGADPARVSSAPRWGAGPGGGQHAQRQAYAEEPLGHSLAAQRVSPLHLWLARGRAAGARGYLSYSAGVSPGPA